MTIGQGNKILVEDYNEIQLKVSSILGTGSFTKGYGQSLASSQVSQGGIIYASHLLNLKTDLNAISIHQSNSASSAPTVSSGGVITATDWTSYNTIIDSLTVSRFNASSAQMSLSDKIAPTFSNWNGTRTHVVTVTFGSADAGRHFFNTGGEIRMYPSQSGFGSGTTKGGRWSSLFSGFSPVRFNYTATTASGGSAASLGWYDMTSSNQQIFTAVDTGTYSGNDITIFARCDVANNSGGTASSLTLTIQFNDDGASGNIDENVDGTTTSKISTFRANGVIFVGDPNVTTISGP